MIWLSRSKNEQALNWRDRKMNGWFGEWGGKLRFCLVMWLRNTIKCNRKFVFVFHYDFPYERETRRGWEFVTNEEVKWRELKTYWCGIHKRMLEMKFPQFSSLVGNEKQSTNFRLIRNLNVILTDISRQHIHIYDSHDNESRVQNLFQSFKQGK